MPIPNEADVIAENKALQAQVEAAKGLTSQIDELAGRLTATDAKLLTAETALSALTELFTQFSTETGTKFAALDAKLTEATTKLEKASADFDKAVAAKVAQLGIRSEPVALTEQAKKSAEVKELTLLQKAIQLHAQKRSK